MGLFIAHRLDDALELAKACGFLPLALRVAGSFLEINRDWQVEKYLTQLDDRKQRLLVLESSQREAELTSDYDLVATFELSYQQLGKSEQLHWQELAVFDTSFNLDAAAHVCSLEEVETQKLLGTLQRYGVIDFSLKTDRYSMHELLAEFALRHVQESKAHNAQFRHSQYFLRILDKAEQDYLRGGEGVLRGLKLFDQEWKNIQRGQDWAARNASKATEIAKIAAQYPSAGVYCLDLRLNPEQRILWLESSLNASRLLNSRSSEGVSLSNLGTAYAALGDHRKATEYYEQALLIAHEIGDRRGEGADLHNLGLAYFEMGEVSKAIDFYTHALNISHEMGDLRGEGTTLGNLGNAYATLGETDKAIEYYNRRLRIAREIGDRRGESNAFGNLGLVYTDRGDIRKAIQIYEQALQINREIGDLVGERASLSNLGNDYAYLGDLNKAIEFYELALVIVREIGDRRGEGNALSNLGLAYFDLGETQKAIKFYEAALTIAQEIGDRRVEGNALGNLGLASANLGDNQVAIEFFEKALIHHRDIGDRKGEGNAIGNLGLAYLALGDFQKAIGFYEQALEIDREIGDLRGVALALTNLGSAFAILGHKDKALSYTQEALLIFEKIESPYVQQIRSRLGKLRDKEATSENDEETTVEDLGKNIAQSVGMNNPQDQQYFEVVPKTAGNYEIGQRVKGKIIRIIPVGLIVELEPGLSGLIHISQVSSNFMTPEKLEKTFEIGEELTALIIDVDREKRKISLSIKQAQ